MSDASPPMAPIKLYVYDLSNGLARQLSMQLTGRQIDGIWHTSIVVFGKETFYGQGINTTLPGRSHHGTPLQIIDLGETEIDEETFNEYIEEMKESYTADKYHLLDFNCNSFTNDVAGFLTGGSIPDFIKDLPTDFLSTPFGAALRPTIDAMYRRPSPGAQPPLVTTPAASSILEAVAARATTMHTPLAATESLAGSIHVCSNTASFGNVIRSHRAVVAIFTNIHTCPPCRAIAPVYEQLASEKGIRMNGDGGRTGAAFVKIDMSTPGGHQVAQDWGISVMPTFKFFLDGKEIDEMKGANPNELRYQIDLLLFQAYPTHPHTVLSLPAFETMSLNPILFSQIPAIDTVFVKLSGFIDSAAWPSSSAQSKDQVKQALSATIVPYLKSRFTPPNANGKSATLPSATPAILTTWSQVTVTLAGALPLESLFPIVDMWRLATLDPAVSSWSAMKDDPIKLLLSKASVQKTPRPYLLTLLRLLSNGFSSTPLAQRLLVKDRSVVTALLVSTLLHEDASVRTAAASLSFNISAFVQTCRIEKVKNGGTGTDYEDEDWEVEMVTAIVEAVDREKENEEVVHRLAASLGCLLRLSPYHETQMPLFEVLQAKQILKGKLEPGGCGEKGVVKKEARKLIEEVTDKLCP